MPCPAVAQNRIRTSPSCILRTPQRRASRPAQSNKTSNRFDHIITGIRKKSRARRKKFFGGGLATDRAVSRGILTNTRRTSRQRRIPYWGRTYTTTYTTKS